MPTSITLMSGSIFNGNPITFKIKPDVKTGKDSDGNTIYPSFHRVIIRVTCGLNTEGNTEDINMSATVEKEEANNYIYVDISSALRTLRDSYEYTPYACTYPYVAFRVFAQEEYMLDGTVKRGLNTMWELYFRRTLFGGFSDFERLQSGETKSVTAMTRKPTSSPHLVAVGESYAYTPSYSTGQTLQDSGSLIPPTSQVVTITQEGEQTFSGQRVYALPASEANKRTVFRFINGFGVLESISIPKAYSKSLSVTSNSYTVSRQETFNSFSRSAVKKSNDRQSWSFKSDPLTEDWLEWYLHEFLMSEHIWLEVENVWVPCTITPDEETTIFDNTGTEMYAVSFTAKLDINGSTRV